MGIEPRLRFYPGDPPLTHLADVPVHGGGPVQQDGVLHQVLDANALHLLQEVAGGLLPRPEVDLCDVIGHRPGRRIMGR